MENLPILQDFVPYWGRCPASPMKTEKSRAGQRNRWPFDTFGRLFFFLHYQRYKCHLSDIASMINCRTSCIYADVNGYRATTRFPTVPRFYNMPPSNYHAWVVWHYKNTRVCSCPPQWLGVSITPSVHADTLNPTVTHSEYGEHGEHRPLKRSCFFLVLHYCSDTLKILRRCLFANIFQQPL